MKKIKVCHIVCGLKSGGVETVIYNYCKEIENEKFEWFLLYQHAPSLKNIKEFESLNFKLHRLPSKVKHPIKNYIETKKYFRENKIDIVHCHMTLMNFIPLIAAKKLGIKTRISHSHNADARKKPFVVKKIENVLKKISIKNATKLMACGDDAGKYMYGTKSFYVLNNAVDLRKFEMSTNTRINERQKLKINDETIVLGHIGRFVEQKNHIFLLNLLKEILKDKKNIKLILVGDGEERKKIEDMAVSMKIKDNIIFTGIMEDTARMYNVFDIFLLPSLWEGLPVVALEAQASGLKCIFANTVDKNVIIDNENAELLELNLKVWKEKIIELIDSKAYLQRRTNEKKFVERNLEIRNEALKLKKIYEGG